MNAFDFEVIESMLESEGYEITSSPSEADAILVNTCSVREHAEIRAIGRLNDLSRHGGSVLAVCGCMAERLGEKLFELVPSLNIVAGPGSYSKLTQAISSAIRSEKLQIVVADDDAVEYKLLSVSGNSPSRYLAITRGCENFCSYCIVPYVRGKIGSKSVTAVIEEIRMLESAGAKEVTLLGQNVMSYCSDGSGFVELIEVVLSETDIERIRFLTTHPRDVDTRIFQLMADDSRICPHLHLPIQSGSDRVLSLMNRGYTSKDYLNIINSARSIRPDIAFTTDVIVGFPGETEEDFEETLEIVDVVRFDSAFTFKYSPREGTKAATLEDNVPEESKKSRLYKLNSIVQENRLKNMTAAIGSVEEILLDARVKKGEYQFLKGRTPHFRNVLVEEDRHELGDIISVVLSELKNFTFIGKESTGR
jgi:tRNA-2-methylthio-N6-dimethylallyladenosine synthase